MEADFEPVARCKDGRELPVEFCQSLVQTTEGAFATTVIRDSGERKKVELALRDHKERLRLLPDTTTAIPWESDAKTWMMTYVGPQVVELLGYPRERWLEKNFWVGHIHLEDRAWVVGYYLNSSIQYESYEFEYRTIAANGRSVWLHDIVIVVGQDGAPVALRGVMIDITEHEPAEESRRDIVRRLASRKRGRHWRTARSGPLSSEFAGGR